MSKIGRSICIGPVGGGVDVEGCSSTPPFEEG
jgi:hypothetical protein